MARITLSVDQETHDEIKTLAKESNCTIRQYVLNALDPYLNPHKDNNFEQLTYGEMREIAKRSCDPRQKHLAANHIVRVLSRL